MKAAINNTLLKSLPKGRDVDIHDTRLTGFVLRVRKSGRASYRVNYGRGKWYTLGRVTDLKPAEAREVARTILGEAAKGNDPAAARRRARAATLREFLRDTYGPWVKTNRKSGKATLERLSAQFVPSMGSRGLPEISPWVVEKWRSARIKEGKAAATINRDLSALKSALNRAVDWGLIDVNPIAKVKPTKVDQKGVVRYLGADEEVRLRDALAAREDRARRERESANEWRRARGYPTMPDLYALPFVDHLRPLVLLAMNTGLRRGELFNLTWADIDFERAMLVVRGHGAKSGQTRHVPLNAEALETLRGWQRTTGAAGGLVFPAADGGRMDNIKNSWRRLLKDAGVTGFRFHDLRHHFASRLVMAGVDLNTVRELLGHADIKMTLRYAHLAPEHKAQAVAMLRPPVSNERPREGLA